MSDLLVSSRMGRRRVGWRAESSVSNEYDRGLFVQTGARCGLFPTVLYSSLSSKASWPPSGTSPMTRAGRPATMLKLGMTM